MRSVLAARLIMHLLSIDKSDSPILPGFLRIAGTVRFDDGQRQTLWFDVPADQEWALNEQGDPWAVLLWPEAVVRGEGLVIDLPVDPTLMDNLRGLQRLWRSWFSFVHHADIKAPAGRCAVTRTKTAQFFSGGVDSFFTLMRGLSQSEYPAVPPTSSLLTIWGFDVPLAHPDEFAAVWALGKDTARKFDMDCIAIATNALELESSRLYLGPLTHGAVIAACGLLLSGRFQNLILASSYDFSHTPPWGSHMLVDPLFSTSQTRLIHDGAAFTRVQKTAFVASDPNVLSRLRVCWVLGGASNCSRCSKCMRTMLTLDLLGLREHAASFDWSDYSLKTAAGTYIPNPNHARQARTVRDAARQRGRDDMVRAINRSLRRSMFKRYVLVGLGRPVWLMLKKVSLLRRFAAPVHRVLTRGLAGR
ncbi:MAG: hypothetical protein ACE363_15595 [Alphaproteobacteria bacterium]